MLSQEGSWESTIQIEVAFSFLISALLNLYFVNESNNLYLAYIYICISATDYKACFSLFSIFFSPLFSGAPAQVDQRTQQPSITEQKPLTWKCKDREGFVSLPRPCLP